MVTPALPFLPQGFLEWSPLFYGFYPRRPHLAITYLCSTFAICLLYLLLILHRSVTPLHPGPPDHKGVAVIDALLQNPEACSVAPFSPFELQSNFKMLHDCCRPGIKMRSFSLL